MVNAPQLSLKVIVGAHFLLTVWASMTPGFLGPAYIYANAFILAFGFWAIISPESVDAMFMFMGLNLVSILLDIIFLGIFQPVGHDLYEKHGMGTNLRNTFRFSLGMAITNLIIKPFTSFVLYRLYQERGGQYGDFNFPGMPGFGVGDRHGNYENIDQSIPTNSGVESASPHQTIEKPPVP